MKCKHLYDAQKHDHPVEKALFEEVCIGLMRDYWDIVQTVATKVFRDKKVADLLDTWTVASYARSIYGDFSYEASLAENVMQASKIAGPVFYKIECEPDKYGRKDYVDYIFARDFVEYVLHKKVKTKTEYLQELKERAIYFTKHPPKKRVYFSVPVECPLEKIKKVSIYEPAYENLKSFPKEPRKGDKSRLASFAWDVGKLSSLIATRTAFVEYAKRVTSEAGVEAFMVGPGRSELYETLLRLSVYCQDSNRMVTGYCEKYIEEHGLTWSWTSKRFYGGSRLIIIIPPSKVVRTPKEIAGHVIGKGGRNAKELGIKVKVVS